MPFTLAHPAAVMPLRRLKYLPVPALIVGSMTPDLPYYIPSRVFSFGQHDTHTIYSSIVICAPLGLLILAVGLLLRRPLTALMTERARWVSLREAELFAAHPLNWLLAIPALLIGSWTHILWDAFTHPGTWLVRRVDALSAPINLFGMYTGEVSHVLQYASSLFGLAVIAYWYSRVAMEAPPEVNTSVTRPLWRWILLLLVIVGAIAMGSFHAVRAHHQELTTTYRLIYLLLTRTLAWFVFLYMLAGTLVCLAQRRPQPQLEGSRAD
jgi:hypothetical protein